MDTVRISCPCSLASQCSARRDSRSPLKAKMTRDTRPLSLGDLLRSRLPTGTPQLSVCHGSAGHQLHSGWVVRAPPLTSPGSPVTIPHTTEDFALPIRLMHGPTLYGPAGVADDPGPAVMMNVALALLLGWFELPADSPGIASPPVDVLVVHDGDDAGFGKVEEAPGDDLVAGGGVELLEFQHVVAAGRGIARQPTGGDQQPMGKQVGQG